MLRVDAHSEEEKNTILKMKELKEEISAELIEIDETLIKNSCTGNSWVTCIRTLSSAFIGQAASLSSYLALHRLLHHVSPEVESLLLISSVGPGLLSAYAIWWGSGQVQNYVSTRSHQQMLDKLTQQIDEIKESSLVGYPIDMKPSKCWAGFLSTSSNEEYQELHTEDLESGLYNKPSF